MLSAKRFSHLSDSLQPLLTDIYDCYRNLTEGSCPADLPAIAHPHAFAISLVDHNGRTYSIGETDVAFPIQSIAKPFVYGLALEHWGEAVLNKVGVEPTGEPFNSLLEPNSITARQYNPMVNAGAIATTSLIPGETLAQRQALLHRLFQKYMGHPVEVNQSLLNWRQQQDHLNRAIAHMLFNFGLLTGEVSDILSLYFYQCSLSVTCQDLAMMAATLANGGTHPISGEQALAPGYVQQVLSIMYTCGLYDFSGQWAYRVGIPAKSGLSGAILAVVPQCLGIAVFSPPLGVHQKSLRGVKVLEALAERLRLHIFDLGAQNIAGELDCSPPCSVTPDPSAQLPARQIDSYLADLYQQYLPLRTGSVYVSEPDLLQLDPDGFGISLVTVEGQIYSVGDSQVPFLIQSISKVFSYGLALEDHGRDYVLTKVDVEPSGDTYNSIIKLEANSKRPYNPMVNTGAIATTSLIQGTSPAVRLQRILAMYRRYIGHRVFVDTPTLVSEQVMGDRNWAIAYLLRHFDMLSGDLKQTLDLYLQQCSVLITCQDLAVMGATLANQGINPLTSERAIQSGYVQDLLSVMNTCGMYDYAGEWVYQVGFPAKSGVGGGIIGVVPGRMGIAVFSPRLDSRGNSVRGIQVCKALSQRLGLHLFASGANNLPLA
ncbi:glutaminase A [Romeria aff. gracilis LEGE 07310]|uniref:Glutaminase n=1 Tax=Vasconcelosia minhoensis LEGE 07310 TaxID=915328 RepID=A0A8J7ALF6_9CYAN|nr:glutaminase A [Romeria gracilis]MBE9076351.1 glutaminase A [Romeria aff. gracilis LEGE 07310]